MKVEDIVVAINEEDQVIDVDSSAAVLEHVRAHLTTAAHIADHRRTSATETADPADDHVIEFFNQDGEELMLVVLNAWHEFKLLPSGRRLPVEKLRARMESILTRRRSVIDTESTPPVLDFPTQPEWDDFLSACAALVSGHAIISLPPHDPMDRRGWFHNTFVHGGNP